MLIMPPSSIFYYYFRVTTQFPSEQWLRDSAATIICSPSIKELSVMDILILACIQKLKRGELVSHKNERLHRFRLEMQQIITCEKRDINGHL